MSTAPRAFRRSVASKKEERPIVAFTLDWVSDDEVDDEGQPVVLRSDTFHAQRPTDERLFVLAASVGSDSGSAEAAAVMDMLRDILSPSEFTILRARLLNADDDVDLEMIQEVIVWLMEEWSSFPTQPSTDSSGSQRSTGAKSTGRAQGKGSTRSNSR